MQTQKHSVVYLWRRTEPIITMDKSENYGMFSARGTPLGEYFRVVSFQNEIKMTSGNSAQALHEERCQSQDTSTGSCIQSESELATPERSKHWPSKTHTKDCCQAKLLKIFTSNPFDGGRLLESTCLTTLTTLLNTFTAARICHEDAITDTVFTRPYSWKK